MNSIAAALDRWHMLPDLLLGGPAAEHRANAPSLPNVD